MNFTREMMNKVTSGMANPASPPAENDVSSVCDITGLDRSQAIVLLKKWPGWQDAVMHYFENPTSALRDDAAADRQWQPQDNIPYADDGLSRPPSPSGGFKDLTDAHKEATQQINDQHQKEQDELNRAMAESMKDLPGQESGTTSNGQHFGPALRSDYNPADWAMTAVAFSREVVDHPPPAKRRRVLGQPAFLRGAPETEYNAPLLTIYHSIPLAREALLFPSLNIFSYGHNPEWWSGSTDENTKSLSMEQSTAIDEDRRKFLAELQCLMAFLDNTTRAYGSVDALTELRYFQYFRPESSFTKVLEAWQAAVMQEDSNDPLSQVFTTSAAKAPEFAGASPETKDLFLITGPVRNAQTQVELLDKIVWTDSANQPLSDVWFERLGHIITMRAYNDETGATQLNLSPTETWYLDRYTPELRETLTEMRRKCHLILREKDNLTRVQHRLAEMPPTARSRASNNVRQALQGARDLLSIASDESARLDTTLVDDSASIDISRIDAQINDMLGRIDSKQQQLSQRKAELDSQIREVMSNVADPATSSMPLRHKYVLQGVATKPNVTYFRTINRDLIALDDDDDGEGDMNGMWQWWRTAWGESPTDGTTQDLQSSEPQQQTPEDVALFTVRKVSAKDVLDAARTEHHTAVLVYADETAMSFQTTPQKASLRQFVEQDNRAFEYEASLQHAQYGSRGRSWSNETNSTIMDEGNPFDDQIFPAYARDATPMSTSTIRSCDEQSSPKPSGSSDGSTHETKSGDGPPAYEEVAGIKPVEMVEQSRNKIGHFAEQFMQKVEEHERNG